MALTVGAVLDYLEGWDRGDRVEINIAGLDLYVRVPSDRLTIGSGQGGPTGDETVVELTLESDYDGSRRLATGLVSSKRRTLRPAFRG